MTAFERDVIARLRHLIKTGRMWGSPEELEAAAFHLVHVLRAARGGQTVGAAADERETGSASRAGDETVGAAADEHETVSASPRGGETVGAAGAPPASLAETFTFWQRCGGPFAGDPDEHARMRSQLFGEDDALARGQVLTGYASVWASLHRDPTREAAIAWWLETLLDDPTPAGAPDRLNIVLFSLMGFVAADPARFVEALSAERERVGGHALRPLHVVAPPGPVDAALGWTRTFTSFTAVIDGLASVLRALELDQT